MSEKKTKDFMLVLSLFAVAFTTSANTSITVLLNGISGLFPNIPITTIYLLSTAPSFIMLGVSLIFGPIVGKKMKYKTLFTIGLLLYSIFGLAPLFYTGNFYFLLVCRMCYAIGFGMITFYNSAFIYVFGPERGSKYVGLVASFASVGTLIFQNTAAPLFAISLNATYVVYLLGVIALILLLLFFKEPQQEAVTEQTSSSEVPIQKKKMGGRVFVYLIVYFFVFLFVYPAMLSTSTVLARKGIDSVAAAGMMMSCFTAGGILSGVVYGKVNELLKRFMVPVMFLVVSGMHVVLFTAQSQIVFAVAYFVIGFEFSFLGPIIFLYGGSTVPPENAALFGSFVTVAAYAAQFCTTPYIGFVGNTFGGGDLIMTPIKCAAIIFAVLGIASLVIDVRPKEIR